MASLLTVTEQFHGYLDELFLLHQEAIVAREWGLSLKALEIFGRLLRNHIEVEDRWLFPVHAEQCDDVRWNTSLYQQEHQKLLSLLLKVEERVERVIQSGANRRSVIELIDYQRTFKNVMEHHEEREEMALLPELDQQLADGELASVAKQCEREWGELLQSQLHAIKAIESALNVEGE